jgi:ATP phosphoribosyltransferase
MRVHDLREIATVLESSARLIAAAPGSVGARRRRDGVGEGERERSLQELAAALESVIRARGKRYVMANVPRDALDRVKSVLPGISGPTVIDLLNGGTHVAVHAVVPQCAIYRTIADLRALGGEGILVTRIERFTP